MKAVQFDKYGGIDVLEVVDVPVPEPGQATPRCVKVKAAAINPGEAKRFGRACSMPTGQRLSRRARAATSPGS